MFRTFVHLQGFTIAKGEEVTVVGIFEGKYQVADSDGSMVKCPFEVLDQVLIAEDDVPAEVEDAETRQSVDL